MTSWNGKPYTSSRPNKVTRNLTRYAGTVYDLDANHSVYVSYTDIFRPQTELDAQNSALKPIEGKNYEIGIKGEYFDGALNASRAILRIDQQNRAKTPNANQCTPVGGTCYEAATSIAGASVAVFIGRNTVHNKGNNYAGDPPPYEYRVEQKSYTVVDLRA